MNNRNELDKEWYFTTFIKAVRFFLLLFMIGMVAIVLFSCGNENLKKQVTKIVEYEKPKIADTVKNDWVFNESISLKKRRVYEQMLNDVER